MRASKYLKLNRSKQRGVVLFISLIILIALTVIGLSAAYRSNLQERMATNLHIQNLAFNAAESAIGGFVVDSQTGNKLDPQHLLYNLRVNGQLKNVCYDSSGARFPCGEVHLDGDRGAAITSALEVQIIKDCDPRVCGGFSLGVTGGGRIGCRLYKIDGKGSVGNQTASSSLWAYEVTACQ